MNRRKTILVLTVLLLLVLVTAGAEQCPFDEEGDSTDQVSQPEPPKKHALVVKNTSGNTFQITVSSPGPPPYPSHVKVTWISPDCTHASNFQTDHLGQVTNAGSNDVGGRMTEWTLPVNPATGQTDTVTMSYDSSYPDQPRVDHFFAESDQYPQEATQTITRPPSWGGQAAAWIGAQPAQLPADQAASYYRWRIQMHFWPIPAQTMTTSLCQDRMALLQGGHTFIAMRFPVLPPTLAYTEPYTLPVVAGPGTPRLVLKDESVWPPTPVLTVPLEYKPQYLTFLESELPAAPGEHWLALGAVTTPVVDCASVPTLTDWSLMADVSLDFGGAQDAGRGRTLSCYYCYEGQTPPASLLGASNADAASYQGWGITCLGPQPLYLETHVRPLNLYGQHTAWVTPTQTISFSHSVWNSSGAPLTVTLAHSSSLGLPWGIYAGAASGPTVPWTPITGPFQLTGSYPGYQRYLWLIATVPADAPSGAETLVITATDVASPTRSVWTSDLAWVGDWVAPPPPPPGYRLYLPLAMKGYGP